MGSERNKGLLYAIGIISVTVLVITGFFYASGALDYGRRNAAQAAELVRPGTKILVHSNVLIHIRNDDGIGDKKYGDQCSAHRGNEILALGEHDGRVLVRYSSSDTGSFYCPDGTIGFISLADWKESERWSAEERRRLDQLEKDKAIVRELMQKFNR